MNETQLESSLSTFGIVNCRMLQFEVELDRDRGVSHAVSGCMCTHQHRMSQVRCALLGSVVPLPLLGMSMVTL